MVAAANVSWSQILTQVSASLDSIVDRPSAEILTLKPSFALTEVSPESPVTAETLPEPVGPMSVGSISVEPMHVGPVSIELMPVETAPVAAETVTQEPDPSPSEAAALEDIADWVGTLDIITGMAGFADEQKRRLREQSASHQTGLDDVRRDLRLIQERLQAAELHAHELQIRADIRLQRVQADAEAQVLQIRAEAETRVQTIRAEAEAWVQIAEEQARVAELRASTAEKWLKRIDAAAKNLLLGGHMNVDPGRT